MSADRKPEVRLDKFPVYVRQICDGGCRAQILVIGQQEHSDCQLAKLEQELGRKPSFSQAASKHIDTSKVPPGCPNGY